MAALSVDKTVVSKMISVVKDVPADIITAIGAAKESGRDRWYQLAVRLRDPKAAAYAREIIGTEAFISAGSDQRLNMLADALRTEKPRTARKVEPLTWAPADRSVSVTLKSSGKQATLSLKERDAAAFARFIADRIEDLYEDFRKAQ